MDQNEIRRLLQNLDSDWIFWKKNPPAGSHFGGIWECQIRSARAVLGSLFRNHGSSLNDEALNTLIIEVEAIVNSRALTTESIGDGTSEAAISPLIGDNEVKSYDATSWIFWNTRSLQ